MAQIRSGDVPADLGGLRITAFGVDVTAEVHGGTRARDGGARPASPVDAALAAAGLVEQAALDVDVAGVDQRPAARGTTAGAPTRDDRYLRVEVPASDGEAHVALVETDGVLRWVLPNAAVARSAGGATRTFDVWVGADDGAPAARGIVGALGRRLVRVLSFKLLDDVLGEVGDFFVRRWEERHRPHRLRSFTPDDYRLADVAALTPDAVANLAGGGRALLLIHGTSSLSHSGFGLLPPETVRGFHDRYAGRVLAFDHPTLSVTPGENAAWLAGALPEGVPVDVDILCHSRGGLVARVLAERPQSAGLDPERLRVHSVTFVATPNNGTTLCDREHLSQLVDAYTNILDLAPDNPVVDALAGLIEMLKQLAVGAYGGLDGAMSMDPRGAFLRGLNEPANDGSAKYHAIAADYEPVADAPLARRIRDQLMDRVFGVPNDLIVPTESVHGWNGAPGFPIRDAIVLPPARGVDHSTFWTADEARDAFESWLRPDAPGEPAPRVVSAPQPGARGRADDTDVFTDVDTHLAKGDVSGLRRAVRALPEAARRQLAMPADADRGDAPARPGGADDNGTVVVLHGIMGSSLATVDGADVDRIWINPWRLANGELRRLRVGGDERVEPRGLLRTYVPLLLSLDRHFTVVPFAFDWRLPLATSAELLAATITGLERRPVHLVAHSMGGLVARRMIGLHPELWDRIEGRLVMLGTPNQGSFAIPLAFTGRERLVRALALADLRNDLDEIRSVLTTFPGSYEMLPAAGGAHDGDHARLFRPETWGATPVDATLLAAAQATHTALAGVIDEERMVSVAGSGHETPFQLRVDSPGGFSYRTTLAGDGRVAHERGRLDGVATYYSHADHGGLVRDHTVLAALDELLADGKTTLLPTSPPSTARGGATDEWRSADELETRGLVAAQARAATAAPPVRAAADLVADAVSDYLPAPEPTAGAAADRTLDVRVRHASLETSTYPVVVGHYEGAPIAGAEAFIDARMDGRLTSRQLMGLYPGELGDVLVLDGDPDVRPPGAVVIGLGPRGELSPTGLARAMTKAVLTYGLSIADGGARPDTRAGLTTVLIGSHGADGLPIETSVQAIIEGTVTALRMLTEQRPDLATPIGELEIVELYAQRAQRAAHAARDVDRYLSPALEEHVKVRAAEHMDDGEGGRSGDLPIEYDAGSWRRLVVTSRDDRGSGDGIIELDFTALGVRARADRLVQLVDRVLLERLVADAMVAAPGAGRVNRALYELLLPADLKHDLSTIDNLHLVVDEVTADFPWELLADRDAPGGAEPLALRAGMLRQLQLTVRRHLEPTRAAENTALVIGNPPGGPAYPPLYGAVTEANAVIETLTGAGYVVDGHVFEPGADPSVSSAELSVALLDGDFRILHVAAHGNFEPAGDGTTPHGGVVIGDGVYLTATTIGQMRRPPDLVFMNCCHLARIGAVGVDGAKETSARAFTQQNLNRLAASLARELMAMGVRAVLAAGWPVSDAAAAVFAQTLYASLLDGDGYGDAVTRARSRAFDADPASNTWAAYQCYGDPAFRLSGPRPSSVRRIRPVAVEELIRLIEDLAVKAGDPGVDNAPLVKELHDLESTLADAWRGRADVLTAFASAHAELERFDDAIRLYRQALTAERATMPIRAVEQLANLSARQAVALHRGAGTRLSADDHAEIEHLFRDAERHLLALLELADTSERRAMLAAVYKRWAIVTQRAELVSNAIDQYLRSNSTYGRLNALQLSAVSAASVPAEVALELDEGRRWFATFEPGRSGSSYWERVTAADVDLTAALLGNELSDRLDVLLEGYRGIFRVRSTPRERESTTGHLLDLAALAGESQRAVLEQLCIDLRDPAVPLPSATHGVVGSGERPAS